MSGCSGLHYILCSGGFGIIYLNHHSGLERTLIQILVNTLLIVGSLNHISSHLFPWLCVTATGVILAIVCVHQSFWRFRIINIYQVFTLSCLFLGAKQLGVAHPQFVLLLVLLSVTALVKLLTWVLVFVFRRSLIMKEERRSLQGIKFKKF